MIQVKGLDELQRELRRVDPRLTKTLQVANKRVSERTTDKAKPRVRALPSPGGAIAVAGIRPRATQKMATVVLSGSNRTIRANVFGASSHWVWGRKRPGSGPWQPWLGNTWQPEQLYGVGPVIREVADTFAPDEYADAVMEALKKAFPN